MLVLSVMFMVLPLVFLKSATLHEHQGLKSFELQIQNLVYLAQFTAIAEERKVVLHFNKSDRVVTVQTDIFHEIYRLPIPPGVDINENTHSLTIQFNYKGSVDQAGSIIFQSAHYAYKLTFLIGQGRFYVEAI
ncbi:competence protein ComGD [Pullulanibacillus pueri]|nr:competence protein ComGD [Pullulanibacillus pueri]